MNEIISICIPAYKNAVFLKRLLDSISLQTYKYFDVIITDDSPGNEVEELCKTFENQFDIIYKKNSTTLNTPQNWNEAIKRAKGDWIKLIHDDDWFSSAKSLQIFAEAIQQNPGIDFFFSAYTNIYEESRKQKQMFLSSFWKKNLIKNPNILIADNVIGPPSVTLHKKGAEILYDSNMKYVVDIDFYIRKLKSTKPFYISQSLINVGINNAQVTKYTFGIAHVHLNESFLLLEKTGAENLKNIIVFDGWWRLLRNFSIKNEQDIRNIGYKGMIPEIIFKMIRFQKRIPASALKKGILSKILMGMCYIKSGL